jgi:hypothetical protein
VYFSVAKNNLLQYAEEKFIKRGMHLGGLSLQAGQKFEFFPVDGTTLQDSLLQHFCLDFADVAIG